MIVIDVSAAASMVREGKNGKAIKRLAAKGEKTLAPDFFKIEAAQVAWKYFHVGMIDYPEAELMLQGTIECVEEFVDDVTLIAEALHESIRVDHSFYDMLYFVLARRMASPLLTCDHKLAKICRDNNVECIELLDY